MGTLYRFELKKMLRQKVLWVAVLLMTVVVLGSGLADAIVGKTDNSKRCKVLSGRVMDDAFLKEVQESENQEDYIVFRNFITACMGTSEHGLVDARQVYAAREEFNESEMARAGLTDGEKEYWHEKESEAKSPLPIPMKRAMREFTPPFMWPILCCCF